MPKVSIILTSYNHAKYIREAIDNILTQTYSDFELIIWDDASTDDSWPIIESYQDGRIKVFRNEVTQRSLLNKAITEYSSGEYIAIHHSDDVWAPDKLEKQVAYLDLNPDIGAVFTWAQIINEYGEPVDNDWFIVENKSQCEWLRDLFLAKNRLNHPSVMYRKTAYESVGGYGYGMAQSGDAEMWSRILLLYPIHVIQERLTLHRIFTDKSNTSGSRPDVAIRLQNEWNIILQNFLLISDASFVFEIFPNLEQYRRGNEGVVKFLLAMACLHESQQKYAWQLGLSWLYELVNDEDLSKKVKDLYGFTYIDLIDVSKNYDVYGVMTDAVMNELHQKLQTVEGALQAVLSSKSWAITKPLRIARNLFKKAS